MMSSLIRFQQPPSQKLAAYSLLDIGRDMVKAVVILSPPGSNEIQVVGWGRAEAGGLDIAGGRLAAEAIQAAVDTALTQAEDSTEAVIGRKVVPNHVILALAGRAASGRVFTVRETRDKPKSPISKREMRSIRRRAENLVRQELPKFLPGGARKWRPVGVTDAGLWLDKQRVTEAIGLSGQDVVYSVFGVAGQSQALKALHTVSERLNLTIANILAAPQALAAMVPHTEAIILDVGGSGTEISLIRDDALVGADSMMFGGHFFTQSLVLGLKIEPDQALALKHALGSQDVGISERIKAETILGEPRRRWHRAVLDSLRKLSPERSLPRHIYLTGGSSLLPGLDKLLRTEAKLCDGAVEVASLTGASVQGVKDLTESLPMHRFALALSLTIGVPGKGAPR